MAVILTERLMLRNWQEEDLEPFAAINQDPRVMEYFPNILSIEEVAAFIAKTCAHIERHGFGFFACALRETNELIGFVGLNIPSFEASFTPCVEVGWRLAFKHWGKGYATEAARKSLQIGFEQYDLEEIVAFTVPQNLRSRHVMERIGMQHDPAGDFYHTRFPKEHPLSLHVLYRIRKKQYELQKIN